MPKPAKKKRVRQLRRAPDARALEWAEKRLERAIKLRDWHIEKLTALSAEIPRLQGIIGALRPEPVFVHASGDAEQWKSDGGERRFFPVPVSDKTKGLEKYLKNIHPAGAKAHGGVVDAGLAPVDEDALLPDNLPGKEVLS